MKAPPVSTPMFQVHAGDLAELERIAPELMSRIMFGLTPDGQPLLDTRTRKQLEKFKTILGNVRWDYGPPSEVRIVEADGGEA
ncbi:MAG: hypothetical protein AAGE65_03630 [Planctomycetota bacterium]